MRKSAPRLITIAVGIGIAIVTAGALLKLHEVRSLSVETASPKLVETDNPNVFETEIDGEKRVIVFLTDTADSVRANSK
jgi:hypothetical protein